MGNMIDETPFFVLGNPRSGTTLLRLILTSHRSLHVPPECGFAVWLKPSYSQRCVNGVTSAIRQEFLSDLFACRKFDTWNLDTTAVSRLVGEARIRNYSDLVSEIYKTHATHCGKETARWGDKNNFHMQTVVDLVELFPMAQFVHLVRDPRDVACSYRALSTLDTSSPYAPELPTDPHRIGAHWAANIQAVMDGLENVPHGKCIHVRYEDLVNSPTGTLKVVCSFLEVPFEEQMLQFHESNRKLGLEPKLTLDWKKQTLNPVSNKSVGQYRSLLTPGAAEDIAAVAAVEMRQFGYE